MSLHAAALFATADDVSIECHNGVLAMILKGILDALREKYGEEMGDEILDEMFHDLRIDKDHSKPSMDDLVDDEDGDYKAGDFAYFENPDHDPAKPEWKGESVIVTADSNKDPGTGKLPDSAKVAGHGTKAKDVASLKDFLKERTTNKKGRDATEAAHRRVNGEKLDKRVQEACRKVKERSR